MAKKKKKKRYGKKKKSQSPQTSLQSKILSYLNQNFTDKPNIVRVYKKFSKGDSEENIEKALFRLEKSGKITIDGKKIHFVKRSKERSGNLIEGKVDLIRSGAAYIVSDDLPEDVYIAKKFTKGALNGDIVKVSVSKRRGKKPEGEIVEIVKRARDQFLGELQINGDVAFVLPFEENMPYDIFIPSKNIGKAENGDVVLVSITSWPEKEGKNPVGKVTEQVKSNDIADLKMKTILIQNGFNIVFPEAVKKESEKIDEFISKEEIQKRIDFREVLTFTIDPDDAKDFDDAISYRELDDGKIEIGVHIADVSHYVKPGSALDKEAEFRATSVYLPDRVCPMLPEKLSNKVCSLRPNEEKLCFSTIFVFNNKHDLESYSIDKTIIESDKRFTYSDAQKLLESGKGKYAKELNQVNTIAKKLRKEKFKHGAINFETDEVRFLLDDNGKPIDVYLKERKDAHLLIEDFMLLSNKTVAKHMAKLRLGSKPVPFVYRVHDKPSLEKLEQFASIAARFGYNLKFEDTRQAAGTLNNLMKQTRGKDEQQLLDKMAIRSMAKAVYTTKNIGHFGLAFDYYSHFTSPIRRYPDVLAHRIIFDHLLGKEKLGDGLQLEEKCKHCSTMERAAIDSEREATKYKQVEYLQDKIGEEFDAIISGVISRGMFAEIIENKCEGFVNVSDQLNEEFAFDEINLRLVGMQTGVKFNIGEKIKIKVISANLESVKVEMDLVEMAKSNSNP